MTKEIQVLSEELEKMLTHTVQEFLHMFKNLSGNQMDIECGTHIRIPTAAGYVSFYKLQDNSVRLTLYLSDSMSLDEAEHIITKSA